MHRSDLGLADLRALPGVAADPDRWDALSRRLNRRIFLRSEGTIVEVGAPQVVSGALLAQSREIVERFNRFYAGVAAAYYTHPELRAEHLVNPLIDPLLELEADQPIATPLSRLDAVLLPDGRVRVIEINSVGVCQFHIRSMLYLVRELARGGFEEDARRLDQLSLDTVVNGFLRYVRSRQPMQRPVIGVLTPSGFLRASKLLFHAAFQRAGYESVFGGPEHLDVSDREIRVRGTRIDVLWADFFFYLAYQCARYQETRFPTKLPDFGKTPEQAAALLADRRFLEHLRTGRVVNISPARSYLALPKSLLSWIHRSDRPVDARDREFLADHVARTYSARDRADGGVALETVARNRGDFLIKPCQYGGSHGVLLGRMAEADAWRDRLVAIWDDPQWVVQEFHEPTKTASGEFVSLGLANFDGTFGGLYIRTSPSVLISARDAGFIPAVAS